MFDFNEYTVKSYIFMYILYYDTSGNSYEHRMDVEART